MIMSEKREDIRNGQIFHVDPKIKLLWGASGIITTLVVWLLLTIFAYFAFPKGLYGIPRILYPILFFFVVGIFLFPYLLWVELRYRNYIYYFTKGEIVVKRGILRIERIVIPYTKIQNVNVSRSLIEQLFGLATVKIETAGSPGHTEAKIEGVSSFASFINELLMRVEQSRAAFVRKSLPKEKNATTICEEDEEREKRDLELRIRKKIKQDMVAFSVMLNKLDKKIDELTKKFEERINAMEEKIDELEKQKVKKSSSKKRVKAKKKRLVGMNHDGTK